MNKTIGIIGYGNMGSAIAGRIKAKYKIIVFDKDKNKTSGLKGINVAAGIVDLLNNSEVVILAVKPQDFDNVLGELKGVLSGKLIISIAAGIPTLHIEKALGNARVVRVMPNIGAKIGESETFFCKGKFTTESDFNLVQQLFNLLGRTWAVEEGMMDSATAVASSGPAYLYYDLEVNKIDPLNLAEDKRRDYIQRFNEAAQGLGFNKAVAQDLAVNLVQTSIGLIKKTGLSAPELRKQITSKGGTTEAALAVLQRGASWVEAALAAKKRAEELTKKE